MMRERLYLMFLTVLFFATRLINLRTLPIFVDEGGYIFWAKQAFLNDQFYLSVLDGKPPLNVWGITFFLHFFPADPVLAGRIFSTITGSIAACGFFILSYLLFGKKTAFISSLLYIFLPFVLFYDRLAIVDSQVNAVFVWMLICSILLVRKTNLSHAIVLGAVTGIGLLTKGNVWLFIYMLIFSPLLLYEKKTDLKKYFQPTIKFFKYFVISVGIAMTIYGLALFPFPNALELINQKSQGFLYAKQEIMRNPFGLFFKNVPPRITMLLHMTGWISVVYALAGLIVLFSKRIYKALYFTLWLTGPIFATTYLLKHFFPRYMIFLATIIVLLAGYFLSNIKNTKVFLALGILLLGIFLYFDYPIIFNYHRLNFPAIEREQYVEGIASGYGINEIITYAKKRSTEKPVILLSEGIFGIGSNMIDANMSVNEKNIQSHGSWPMTRELLHAYQQHLPQKNVFVILNYRERSKVPNDWPIEHIKTYDNSYPYPHFSLYRLIK